MTSRALRAVVSITVSLAAMGLAAYAFGHLTHTEWVWWLAPLTVAFDTSLLSPSGVRAVSDPRVSVHLIRSMGAAGVAAWGAYAGHRSAIIIGAASAIVGRALVRDDESTFEQDLGHASTMSPYSEATMTKARAIRLIALTLILGACRSPQPAPSPTPPEESSAIRVGGQAGLHRAPPAFYVIDGVLHRAPFDFSTLDPDRIVDVQVLRGDAAIERFGPAAAAGVIVVRTKDAPTPDTVRPLQ